MLESVFWWYIAPLVSAIILITLGAMIDEQLTGEAHCAEMAGKAKRATGAIRRTAKYLKEKDKWVHPQDKISIKENHYDCDRFKEMFDRIQQVDYAGEKTCRIAGVRCEESPARLIGLSYHLTYKDITWGRFNDPKKTHFRGYSYCETGAHRYLNWKA